MFQRIKHWVFRYIKEIYFLFLEKYYLFQRSFIGKYVFRTSLKYKNRVEGHFFNESFYFFLESDIKERIFHSIELLQPSAAHTLYREAEKIKDHTFLLLGSGETELQDDINWHKDFKSGREWNPLKYYKRIHPANFPGGYDIKIPWELSRFQHAVRLGQAYWKTENEEYAEEFTCQIMSWIDNNPWPFGVNWSSTMDTSIRAVNWIWGYFFFKDSKHVNQDFLEVFLQNLYLHGEHIYKNLEYWGENTNNHYISNLVGLIFLGLLFNDPISKEWLTFGTDELWQAIFSQVNSEGVSVEGSIPYHRLVVEFFLTAVILCQKNDIHVPDEVFSILEKMLDYVMLYTKPDGTVPILGDADNGRLQRLSIWEDPEREWIDHRYLLAIGAVVFQRDDFADAAGSQWQEAYWLLGDQAINYYKKRRGIFDESGKGSEFYHFPTSGVSIIRAPKVHLLVRSGLNQQAGKRGHEHNDELSFELFAGDRTWIVDPGSFVYTQDYAARNMFRSTEYHNNPIIFSPEIVEQNNFHPEDLFRLEKKISVHSDINYYGDRIIKHTIKLSNYGAENVNIDRVLLSDIDRNLWMISDRVTKGTVEALGLQLHMDNCSVVNLRKHPGCFLLVGNERSFLFLYCINHYDVIIRQESGWVSPSYGRKHPSSILNYKTRKHAKKHNILLGLYWLESATNKSVSRAAKMINKFKSKQVF